MGTEALAVTIVPLLNLSPTQPADKWALILIFPLTWLTSLPSPGDSLIPHETQQLMELNILVILLIKLLLKSLVSQTAVYRKRKIHRHQFHSVLII